MVRVDRTTVTLGNILSIVTTLVAFGTVLVGVTLYIARLEQRFAVKDEEHDRRIVRIEADVSGLRSDHDVIVEMRADLKAIRSAIDKLDRRNP